MVDDAGDSVNNGADGAELLIPQYQMMQALPGDADVPGDNVMTITIPFPVLSEKVWKN